MGDELDPVPTNVVSESICVWGRRSRWLLLLEVKLSKLDWAASFMGEENCWGVEFHAGGEVAR